MTEEQYKIFKSIFEMVTFKLDFVSNATWDKEIKVAYINTLQALLIESLRKI